MVWCTTNESLLGKENQALNHLELAVKFQGFIHVGRLRFEAQKYSSISRKDYEILGHIRGQGW